MSSKVIIDKRGLKTLEKKLGSLDKLNVRVGLLQGKGAETVHPDGGITMAELGAIHEFGAPKAHIPQRSWLRGSFENVRAEEDLQKLFARAAARILSAQGGKLVIAKELGIIGAWGAARVQQRIRDKIPPPNAASTVKAKGSSTPLVDTGRFRQAIQWELEDVELGDLVG